MHLRALAGVLGVTVGGAETLVSDPGCPEAATLATDGMHLALYNAHAACIGRFILEVHSDALPEEVYFMLDIMSLYSINFAL